MRLYSFLAFGLSAAALALPAAVPRPARISTAAGQNAPTAACQSAGSAVRSRIASTTDAAATPTVGEIDLDGLKKLLRRDPKESRPLLVNFWATWCEPCRDEFPELVQIDADYKARGLEFITISLDEVTEINGSVPQFLQEMRAPMPTYLLNVPDPEPAIKAVDPAWGGALPATFLYDASGQVVFKHMGRIRQVELRASLEKVMRAK